MVLKREVFSVTFLPLLPVGPDYCTTQATLFKRGSEGDFLLGHLVFAQMLYPALLLELF
jgi:hypothetical protein